MSENSLALSLGVDGSGLSSGLKNALGDWDGFLKGLGGGKEIIAGLSVAMAGVGAAALGLAKHAAEVGDHLLTLSDKTGIAVEDLSLLKFAAEQNNTNIDQLANGLKVLGKNMVEAEGGNKNMAKAFEDLGIQIKNADGSMRPVNDVMLDLADAVAGIQDPAKQSAVLMELMGKQGIDLSSFMKAGSEGITQATEAAKAMGLEMSGNSVKAGAAFLDNADAIKTAVTNLGTQFGASLLEPLAELSKIILEAIIPPLKTLTDWFKSLDSDTKMWIVGLSALGVALGTAVVAIGAVTAAVGLFSGAFTAGLAVLGGVAAFLTGPVGLAIAGVAAAIAAAIVVWKNWDRIVAAFEDTAKAATGFIEDMVAEIRRQLIDRFNAIVEGIRQKIDAVKGFFKDLYDVVVGNSYIPDMVAKIAHSMGEGLERGMVGPAKSATQKTSEFFKTLGENIKFSIGDAVARSIVYHEDLKKSFEDISKAILASVIAFATRIMVEWAAMEAFRLTTTQNTNAAITASNTTTSTGLATGGATATAPGAAGAGIGGAAGTVGVAASVYAFNTGMNADDNRERLTAVSISPTAGGYGIVAGSIRNAFGEDEESDNQRLARHFGRDRVAMNAAKRRVGVDAWSNMGYWDKVGAMQDLIRFVGLSVDDQNLYSLDGDERAELSRIVRERGLKDGGIVTRETMRLLGEAGPEAVIPLKNMGQMGFGGGHTFKINLSLPGVKRLSDITEYDAEKLLKTVFSKAAENLNRSGYRWPMQPKTI